MKRSCLFLQFTGILFLLLFLTAQAQANEDQNVHTITVEIPEMLKMEMGSGEIAFDLAHPKAEQPYPAPVYPAYYTPTSTTQYLPVRVFANGETRWRLLISGETVQSLGEGAVYWDFVFTTVSNCTSPGATLNFSRTGFDGGKLYQRLA